MPKYPVETISDAVITCSNDGRFRKTFDVILKKFLDKQVSYTSLRQETYRLLDDLMFTNWGSNCFAATSKVLYNLVLQAAESLNVSVDDARDLLLAQSPPEAINCYFYENDNSDSVAHLKMNVFYIRSTKRKIPDFAALTPTSKQENDMADAKLAVETITFVYGTDVKNVSDDTIFGHIANLEGQIKSLEAIETKPKALIAKIAGLKADIAALVKISDDRQPA